MKWLDGITNSMDMSLSKLGDSKAQGSLVCCSSWAYKELDTTWQQNNNTVSSKRSEIHSDWIGLGHKSTSEPMRMNSA